MRTAVISDIHGNLEAFNRVLEVIDTLAPDRVISLGDNIGYGPDSNRVMDIVREREIVSVLGNHEMAVKDRRFLKWFNPVAKQSALHIMETLSPENIETICTWEKALVQDNIRFVHGAPLESPFLYLFQLPDNNLVQKMITMPEPLCFVGHTHELELVTLDEKENLEKRPLKEERVLLDPDRRYIVNAGSVGQPRDETNEAKMVLYDTVQNSIDVIFVTYPYRETAEKIIRAGLPSSFAEKLY